MDDPRPDGHDAFGRSLASIAAGFAHPVFDSQRAFRAAMEALANPGGIRPAGEGLADAPLPAAAAALALALCDYETPLYLSPAIAARPGAAEYLRFHTDAPLSGDPAEAAFAIVDLESDGLDLASFAQGVPEYPDRSTTVIVVVRSVAEGPAVAISGPGVDGVATLRIDGLPGGFIESRRAARAAFPLGVDLIFASADAIVGLPRSARVAQERG